MTNALAPLAGDLYYLNGTRRTQSDKIMGQNIEVWIKPLDFGTRLPPVFTITEDVPGTVVQGSTELVASATDDQAAPATVTIYKGDVLLFGDHATGVPIVVSADTIVSTGTTIPIFAASASLTIDNAKTYGMIPYFSIMEGGPFNITGNLAESLNRGEGLFPSKGVVRRDANTTANGAVVRNDVALALISNAALTTQRFLWQSRYNPFISFPDDHFGSGIPYQYGAGVHAKEGVVIIESADMPAPNEDFAQFNATVTADGAPYPYQPLTSA